MAFEIKITSNEAERALDRVERAITSLAARMEGLGNVPGLDAFITRLGQLRVVDPSVLNSLLALEGAAQRLATAAVPINQLTAALFNLARVDVSKVASNVQALSTALSNLVVPSNIANLANAFNTITAAATTAAASVSRLNSALGTVNAGGIQQAAQNMNNLGQQTQQASSHMNAFASIGNVAVGMLAAMGIQMAASGIVSFISNAYKASVTMDQFMVSMRFATGTNEKAAESFAYLREVARQTGQPIDALIPSFRKFEQAAISAGFGVEQSQQTFTKFSAVFRAFGLTSEQTKRSFTALEQMMAKGTISMEELRQQLGENVPAFSQLAQAIGKPESELAKLISQGQISASAIGKLGDQMFEAVRKTGAFAEALKQPQARLAIWQSQLFEFQAAFGANFIRPVLDGLDRLAAAFGGQENMIKFGETMGWLAGVVLRSFIDGIAVLVTGFKELYRWCADVVTGFRTMWAAASALGQTIVQVMQSIANGIKTVWDGLTSLDFSKVADGLRGINASVTTFGWQLQQNFNQAREGIVGVKVATDETNTTLTASQKVTRDLTTDIGSLEKTTGTTASTMNNLKVSSTGAGTGLAQAGAGGHNAAGGFNAAASSAANLTQQLNALAEAQYTARSQFINTPGFQQQSSWAQTDALGRIQRDTNDYGAGSYTGPGGYDSLPQFSGYGSADPSWQSFGSNAGTTYGETFKVGGISHIGGNGRVAVPTSAFVNAPHFAQGGLSDGGIPSILHPGEAVIPLQNGGVPVNLTGGGSTRDPLAARQLQCLYDINQNTLEVRQTIIDMNVLTMDAFQKTQAYIAEGNSILAGMRSTIDQLPAGVAKLSEAIAAMRSTFSSISSSSSSTSSSGGGGASRAGTSSIDQSNVPRTLRAADGAFGGTSGDYPNAIFYTADDGTIMLKPMTAGFALGSPNAFKDVRGFADGSPNAMVDAKGGFHAILHPDEAVVPLPDGRSIPVDIRGGSTNRELETYEREAERRERKPDPAQPAQQVINHYRINMQVVTPDVASFGKSQVQLTQDLQRRLDLASRRAGRAPTSNSLIKRAE